MQVLFLVLNRLEKIDQLLEAFSDADIRGATVINSTGMAHALVNNHEDDVMFASLRAFFVGNRQDNRTIFMVLDDDKVAIARKIINDIIDLSSPDSGIVFGVPISFVEGISNKNN